MRKEFPAQVKNRHWWVLQTVREHQLLTSDLLKAAENEDWDLCRDSLNRLKGNDRRALLQFEGILTDEQIEQIGYW